MKLIGEGEWGRKERILEQFPDEISDYRRNVLFPLQREARSKGQRAHIVVDKLFVNNVLSSAPTPPPYRLPKAGPHTRPSLLPEVNPKHR